MKNRYVDKEIGSYVYTIDGCLIDIDNVNTLKDIWLIMYEKVWRNRYGDTWWIRGLG